MTAPSYGISLMLTRGRQMGMTVQNRRVSLTMAVTYGTFSSTKHFSQASPLGYTSSISFNAFFCISCPCAEERYAMHMTRFAGTVSIPADTMVRQMDLISARIETYSVSH